MECGEVSVCIDASKSTLPVLKSCSGFSVLFGMASSVGSSFTELLVDKPKFISWLKTSLDAMLGKAVDDDESVVSYLPCPGASFRFWHRGHRSSKVTAICTLQFDESDDADADEIGVPVFVTFECARLSRSKRHHRASQRPGKQATLSAARNTHVRNHRQVAQVDERVSL